MPAFNYDRDARKSNWRLDMREVQGWEDAPTGRGLVGRGGEGGCTLPRQPSRQSGQSIPGPPSTRLYHYSCTSRCFHWPHKYTPECHCAVLFSLKHSGRFRIASAPSWFSLFPQLYLTYHNTFCPTPALKGFPAIHTETQSSQAFPCDSEEEFDLANSK